MYQILLYSHSWIRWGVLVFLIISILQAYQGKRNNLDYTDSNKKMALFALIFSHIQLLIGLSLFVFSPIIEAFFTPGPISSMKDSTLRFFTIEHPLMMLIALVLVTIGFSKSKRAESSADKFAIQFKYYGIALFLILIRIPWPFLQGRKLFPPLF